MQHHLDQFPGKKRTSADRKALGSEPSSSLQAEVAAREQKISGKITRAFGKSTKKSQSDFQPHQNRALI